MTRAGAALFGALIVAALCGAAPGAASAADVAQPATLRVAQRDVITFRATTQGFTPAERVDGAIARVRETRRGDRLPVVTVADVPEGTQVLADGTPLFVVVEGDVNLLGGETPHGVAAVAAERLTLLVDELRERENPRAVAIGLGLALAATLAWILVVRLIILAGRRVHRVAAERSAQLEVSGVRVFSHRTMLAQAANLLRLLALLLIGAVTFVWLDAVLMAIPHTRPWGERLSGMLFDTLAAVGLATMEALPGLLFIIVIVLIATGVLRIAGAFFRRVESHRLTLGFLDRDTARPIKMLFTLLVCVFATAMAYPHLPGADSRALQGLTVLLGLMVSIGASGTVSQGISGLILMFSRTFRVGDYVRIGDKLGTVTEIGLFITRLRSGLGDEVVLPNTHVLAQHATNYSRAGPGDGFLLDTTVTIGYDAPWRLVAQMLVQAALQTPGVAAEPAPRVVQAALSDFYVEYRLVAHASATSPDARAGAIDRLNANIQDVFNANGVQIMSPHYRGDPAGAKVVPPERWHVAARDAGA